MIEDTAPVLYWDLPYAIALAIREYYPARRPEETGLQELADLVETLPGFADDPAFVTERTLLDIQVAWIEETLDI